MINVVHPVLDKGHCILTSVKTLIEGQPDLDLAVVQAARASTVSGWDNHLTGLKGPQADMRLLKYLWENSHHSPWEHVVFTFHVKAPLMTLRQWQRHRTWSYNEMSGRYQEYDEEFYAPDTWRTQDTKNKQGSAGEINSYDQASLGLAFQDTISLGIERYKAALSCGVTREQARIFLPAFALYSEMYATVDLRNLINFLKERTHPAAQYEIRVYAETIKRILWMLCPKTMQLVFGEDTNHGSLSPGGS